MLRNYLLTGVRALTRNPSFAAINILGLAIGMAACILLLLFVRHETSYDSWLPDHERIFQVQSFYTNAEGTSPPSQLSAFAVGRALAKDFPQIERLAYVAQGRPVVLQDGRASTALVLVADPTLLQILRFPMRSGDRATALKALDSIVLTAEEADARFPGIDPMGKTLTVVWKGIARPYRITGILEKLPANTHFKGGMITPFNRAAFADNPQELIRFGWNSGYNYVQLRPGARVGDIQAAMPAWEKRNMPPQPFAGAMLSEGDQTDWCLTPLASIHLGAAQEGAQRPGNDPRTIATFGLIAVLILAMACINFTNLATARAGHRAREVALRKVLGASRTQLIVQFLGESMLVAAAAMLVALAVVELVLPGLSSFLDAELRLHYFGPEGAMLPVAGLIVVVGLAAGLYPAFVLSRFDPAPVLKANVAGTTPSGAGGGLRSLLVVGQFAVSIGLIICTGVVWSQTNYARNADTGFDRAGLIQIDGIARKQLAPVVDNLVTAITAIQGVKGAGRTMVGVNTDPKINSLVRVVGRPDPIEIGTYGVDAGFFDTIGIKMLAGRQFDANRAADDSRIAPNDPAAEKRLVERGIAIIINKSAVQTLGFASPSAAVGKTVRIAMVAPELGLVPATVIGVVPDTRFRSAREPVGPMLYRLDTSFVYALLVRVDRARAAAVLDRIAAVWTQFAPQVPFESRFADDIVREQYQADEARALTFAAFAGLAIIVACLGLYGLAAFTAERRTREIGIRKVLGARDSDIVQLLVWQFSRPVLLANLIAWPVAFVAMRDWLGGFAARIDLGPAWFIAAGGVAVVIAAATIIGHALKVARANPSLALRYE